MGWGRTTITMALLVSACGGEVDDFAETEDELGGRCNWTVEGRLQVDENATTGEFVDRPLAGIEVRVYGSLINNGGFASWGTTHTDSNGRYKYTKRKSCSKRNLRVQARFRNDDLEVNTPGHLDWMKIYETTSKRSAGTLDLGTRRFSLTSFGDLRDFDNNTRAKFYYVVDSAMKALRARDPWFAFDRKIKIRYPAVTTNDKSWADGISMTAYMARGDRDIDALLHEVMHLWNYQHNYGTTDWIGAVLDGTTHGFQEEPNVAFHEGFAEFAKDGLLHEVWGRALPRPRTRWWLNEKGLVDLRTLERNDAGVKYGLWLLTSKDIYRYVFGVAHDDRYKVAADRIDQPVGCPRTPDVDFWDVLRVFRANPAKGWSRDWEVHRDSYGLRRFYNRAADILDNFSEADEQLYLQLLDTSLSNEPQDRCRRIVRLGLGD